MTFRDTVRLLIPAVALVVASFIIYAIFYWNEPLERAARRMADVATALQPAASSGSADAVSPMLASVAVRSGYERVWIVDGSGLIVFSSRETEAGTQLNGPWGDLLMAATTPSVFEATDWGDRRMLFSAHRSAATGRWSAVLEDGTPIARERWVHLALLAAVGFMALTLVGFAMQVAVGRRLLHPMTVLSEHVDDLSTGKAAPTAALERIGGRGGEALEKIAGAVGALWTERDSLRRELHERHALHLAATYLTGEMIMVATFDGRIAEANRSFCDHLGLDRNRIVGRLLGSLEGVLPAKALRELGEQSAREKRPFERLLFTFAPPGGTPMDVVAAVQAVPFGGEPAFMLVAGRREKPEAEQVDEAQAGTLDDVDASAEKNADSTAANAGSDGGDAEATDGDGGEAARN